MKLSVVIPVYNEEQTIGEVVERVLAVDLGDIEKELIISNDGSSELMRSTVLRYCFRSRSLRLPKIWVRKLVAMNGDRSTLAGCGHFDRNP